MFKFVYMLGLAVALVPSANLNPTVSAFKLPTSAIGSYTIYQGIGVSGIKPHAIGQDQAIANEYHYREFYYGVTPRGFTAKSAEGIYTVGILPDAKTALGLNTTLKQLYNTSISGIISPANAWSYTSELISAYGPTGVCTVVVGQTVDNLEVMTYFHGITGEHPSRGCGRQKGWVAMTQHLVVHAAEAYAAKH